ncbi:hypothetical protein G8770_21230 [Aestuariicella hydrocarbonica]|uniref:Uncharacterized protein n=1 Tax=Pseudomaricurvus hydrocarbonicus TaxID=1470433 RepID=A0A9E5MPG4_9GAMM|nr:hypothetical protein [Aestuariicella hydrocarbonica]NHO68079.1 hypothetical protein [Aestuariicella hydrocarbonica]
MNDRTFDEWYVETSRSDRPRRAFLADSLPADGSKLDAADGSKLDAADGSKLDARYTGLLSKGDLTWVSVVHDPAAQSPQVIINSTCVREHVRDL